MEELIALNENFNSLKYIWQINTRTVVNQYNRPQVYRYLADTYLH